MKKTMLAFMAVLSISAAAHASQQVNYSCDDQVDSVTVAYDDNGKAVALYGVADVYGDGNATDANARAAVNDLNLRVSKFKNGIVFTLVLDEHEGETQDIHCKRSN